jgi:hypothetical protein
MPAQWKAKGESFRIPLPWSSDAFRTEQIQEVVTCGSEYRLAPRLREPAAGIVVGPLPSSADRTQVLLLILLYLGRARSGARSGLPNPPPQTTPSRRSHASTTHSHPRNCRTSVGR